MSDSKTNQDFLTATEVRALQPQLVASGDKPDLDTSSMRGYAPGSSVFDPHGELPEPTTSEGFKARANGFVLRSDVPKSVEAPKSYDVDSSSMRGFTSGGPAPTV